jgi:hypothetical protein
MEWFCEKDDCLETMDKHTYDKNNGLCSRCNDNLKKAGKQETPEIFEEIRDTYITFKRGFQWYEITVDELYTMFKDKLVRDLGLFNN